MGKSPQLRAVQPPPPPLCPRRAGRGDWCEFLIGRLLLLRAVAWQEGWGSPIPPLALPWPLLGPCGAKFPRLLRWCGAAPPAGSARLLSPARHSRSWG